MGFPKEEEEEEEEDERRLRPRSLMIMLALVGGAAMLMLFYDGNVGLRYHHQRNKSHVVQGVLHRVSLQKKVPLMKANEDKEVMSENWQTKMKASKLRAKRAEMKKKQMVEKYTRNAVSSLMEDKKMESSEDVASSIGGEGGATSSVPIANYMDA